jgi:hypothetical protein
VTEPPERYLTEPRPSHWGIWVALAIAAWVVNEWLPGTLFGVGVCLLFAAVFLAHGMVGIHVGRVMFIRPHLSASRWTDPAGFWTLVAFNLLGGLSMIVLAILAGLRLLS